MRGYPNRYVVFDTEARLAESARPGWDIDQTWRLAVAKTYDPVVRDPKNPAVSWHGTADDLVAMLRMMPMDKEKIYIFAHNIGYDLRIMGWWRYVTAGVFRLSPPEGMPGGGRYKRPLIVMDGFPTILRFFRDDGQQFMLLDSFNWLPMSLARIGEAIGEPKGVMPDFDADDEVWYPYCERDVHVLDRALRRLWGWMQCMSLPDFQPTPASQARSIYRMRYEKKRIIRPAGPEPLWLDRHAYYGGFVEAFRLGRVDRLVYQVDVNGLYPKVMCDNHYPCEIKTHVLDPTHEPWTGQIDPREATAEVWLESPDTTYPVRCANGTYHVRGRVRTVLCGPELERAVSRGHVRFLGRHATFRMDMLFDKYVNTFWDLRRRARDRGDALIDRVCKSLLNALHGKFGQRDGEWQHRGRTESPGLYANGKVIGSMVHQDVEARVLDGHMFERARDQEHGDGFVPIAAWCASYARVYMEEMVDVVGRDHTLYQCVDSLLVTGDGLGSLQIAGILDTGELGHFKLEDTFEWVDIITLNQVSHSKGGKHSGIKSGSAVLAAGIWEVEEWEGFAAGVTAGNVSSVSTRKLPKRPSTRYCRRHVDVSGNTIPFSIENWSIPPEEQRRLNLDGATGGRAK